jgi:hypothetical protein
MINRRMMLRSLIAAIFVALLTVVSTQDAAAQWTCKCDAITVTASKDIQCKFTLCVESPAGLECQTIGPGTVTQFKCVKEATPWIKDCQGNQVFIKADCNLKQTQIVPISSTCCVSVCAGYDSKGCLFINIEPAKAPCAKC